MKQQYYSIVFLISSLFMTWGCNNEGKPVIKYDTPTEGTIYISVDESFKPVISEQIKVYEGSYPKTHIIASYKPEADCLRDLQKDSIKMVIVAKGLSEQESKAYTAALSYKPQWDVLAYDAVCAIVNKNDKDSLFSLAQLKKYLSGKDSSRTIVLDGKNATSTVRFIMDSLLRGENFGINVVAANNSKEVINYIAQHEGAIGFVGSSWICDSQDPEQLKNLKTVRLALVECERCGKGVFAKPSQATISYGQYPLVRPLYFIIKDNANGLGSGFVNFLNYERGQLVFRRSYLVPAKMYFGRRTTKIE